MNLDYERLRDDLINYFGTATSFFNAAFATLNEVMIASNEQLVLIALNNGFDLNDYKVVTYERK